MTIFIALFFRSLSQGECVPLGIIYCCRFFRLKVQRMWKLMFINLEAKGLLPDFCCWCRWTLKQTWHCILVEAQLVFVIIQYTFVITLFPIFVALCFIFFGEREVILQSAVVCHNSITKCQVLDLSF